MEEDFDSSPDFDEGLTSTKSPDIYVKLTILQRRYELINAFKSWRRNTLDMRTQNELIACIETLFVEIESQFTRRVDNLPADKDQVHEEKQGYEWVIENIFKLKSKEDIIKAIKILNQYCDEVKLTRFDTRKHYDRTILESENLDKDL